MVVVGLALAGAVVLAVSKAGEGMAEDVDDYPEERASDMYKPWDSTKALPIPTTKVVAQVEPTPERRTAAKRAIRECLEILE